MTMRIARLGDVADVRWGDTSVTKDSYTETGFVAYSASGPDGFLPYADYDQIGVVLSAIGSKCGKTWLAKGKWSCIKNTIRILPSSYDVDIEYLYWTTKAPDYWPQRGSGQPFISQGDARDILVPVRDLAEQRQIASILGALDDKIENNRKTAATLEEMARALYRSWFVDFDPVHAKAAGEKPAFMDEETVALFPDRFGDDGLPEGWRDSCLSDIATFLNGVALQKYPPAEGDQGFPAIKIAELRNGLSKNTGRASSHIPEKYQVNNGDVLFSWSGSLLQRVWTEDAGALNQHLFKVSSTAVPRWFHYFAVDQHIPAFQEVAASKATTMGHIQRHHLDEAEVTVPDECVLQLADSVIGPIFAKAIALELESRTLAEVRDTLLPRLMSGEIRVGEAREQVEEVT